MSHELDATSGELIPTDTDYQILVCKTCLKNGEQISEKDACLGDYYTNPNFMFYVTPCGEVNVKEVVENGKVHLESCCPNDKS